MHPTTVELIGKCYKINPYDKTVTEHDFKDKTPQEILNMNSKAFHNGFYTLWYEPTSVDTPATWKYSYKEYDKYEHKYITKYTGLFEGICYITGTPIISDNILYLHGVTKDHASGVIF